MTHQVESPSDWSILLTRIGADLCERELRTLCFVHAIPERSVERIFAQQDIQRWSTFVRMLLDDDVIFEDDTDGLIHILKSLHRQDLIREVNNYAEQSRTKSIERKDVGSNFSDGDPHLAVAFEFLETNFKPKDWKKLIRALELESIDIDDALDRNIDNEKDAFVECLRLWGQTSSNASVEVLKKTMKSIRWNLSADLMIESINNKKRAF